MMKRLNKTLTWRGQEKFGKNCLSGLEIPKLITELPTQTTLFHPRGDNKAQ
ncbi:MAG: hypothetical protein IPH77_19720 [Ignavibacteria bacterium]|nr:hypothetical protein [Ignavibacteria bacterium]